MIRVIYSYQFVFADGEEVGFRVDTEREPEAGDLPAWTRLGYHRCDNCPLSASETDRCPPAADLHGIASHFRGRASTGRVRVTVSTASREFAADCDVQTGLRSLIGLVMASSECPLLTPPGDGARFHLPFATFEETLSHVIGGYLRQQYLVAVDGGDPDWQMRALRAHYRERESVYRCFSRRLEAASDQDANLNAIVALFSMTQRISLALDADAELLRKLLGADP